MNKDKFEKMAEMMKGCCTDQEGAAGCCSMMKKMMGFGEGNETEKEKEESEKTE